MRVEFQSDCTMITQVDCLDLAATLDCGQAFRWRQEADGCWYGVVCDCAARLEQRGADTVVLHGVDEQAFESVWRGYFDLDRDYAAVLLRLCEEPFLARAVHTLRGIRVLRQDPWEALCSFIISQNNNIPRIKGIIARLCEQFGCVLSPGCFSFPSAQRLAALSAEALAPVRAGFRARYLLDAACKVADGTLALETVAQMDTAAARERLMQITGVGPKVADCVLLYGMGHMEVCPMDVWMKRVTARLYPGGLPACTRGVEGIAQQYLFHYARTQGIEPAAGA